LPDLLIQLDDFIGRKLRKQNKAFDEFLERFLIPKMDPEV
jgi:hypothetical protein